MSLKEVFSFFSVNVSSILFFKKIVSFIMQRISSIDLQQRGGFYILGRKKDRERESLTKIIQNDPNSIILN